MRSAADLIEEARTLLMAGAADADTLYRRWFHGEAGTHRAWPDEGAYRAATLDVRRFERGWRAVRPAPAPKGAMVVVRHGFERLVAPPQLVPQGPGRFAPGAGDPLWVDPLAGGLAGGFYHIWSAAWQRQPPRRMFRIYFNLRPEHALDLAVAVTRAAPPRVNWAAKFLCGTHERGRRDGALLYLPASAAVEAGWTRELVSRAAPWCDEELVPLVFRLAPGIGRVRDPSGEMSFGQALCTALWSLRDSAAEPRAFAAAARREVRRLGGRGR